MTIYFLRHGDASAASRYRDSERPLSNLGQQQSSAVGRYLVENHAEIGTVFCSPLLRARQTAEAVLAEIGRIPIRETESLSSSSDPLEILSELKKIRMQNVLLVGHEPQLSRTISLLLWGDNKSRVEMGKCSLACISVSNPPEKGMGSLEWLVTSSQTLKG
jgi:phosphohistidine phosphatase SixA